MRLPSRGVMEGLYGLDELQKWGDPRKAGRMEAIPAREVINIANIYSAFAALSKDGSVQSWVRGFLDAVRRGVPTALTRLHTHVPSSLPIPIKAFNSEHQDHNPRKAPKSLAPKYKPLQKFSDCMLK